MTRKQMVAEISTTLKQYDEAGLLDFFLINRWIRNALKEFGGNGMVGEEITLEVINGKARLPENFYSLALALKCDLEGLYVDSEDKKHLQSTNFYLERTEISLDWDNTLGERPCVAGVDCKSVTEEVYFLERGGKSKVKGEIYYNNISPLRLKRGWKKANCDRDCPNLYLEDCPDEISIHGQYIHANFESGFIYIRYRGLPVDEDGDLMIMDTDRGNLQEYVKYTCIRRVLQELLTNSDDPNVIEKWKLYKQLEGEAYLAAKNDLINQGMLGWKEAIKRKNRMYNRKFEVMYSAI